jgi:hypothetical protein
MLSGLWTHEIWHIHNLKLQVKVKVVKVVKSRDSGGVSALWKGARKLESRHISSLYDFPYTFRKMAEGQKGHHHFRMAMFYLGVIKWTLYECCLEKIKYTQRLKFVYSGTCVLGYLIIFGDEGHRTFAYQNKHRGDVIATAWLKYALSSPRISLMPVWQWHW